MDTNRDKEYCTILSEDEIDAALTEYYIKQGRYNLVNRFVYCSMTGKLIGEYEKPVER